METSQIGALLVLLIIIYFLFRIGIRLYEDNLGDGRFWAWSFTIIAIFIGYSKLEVNNFMGFIGFIPILTYIVMKIVNGMDFGYSTKNKIKGVIFSSIASVATYGVTSSFFGYGTTVSSTSAIIAAAVIGIFGMSA